MIGRFFHHLPWGGEGNTSQVKAIKSNEIIRLIKLYQRIELMKSNQGMGLMKPNQDIQSL